MSVKEIIPYEEVKKYLADFVAKVQAVFGDKLDRVILYGSYARGDYDENSDVDIMILADIPQNKIGAYFRSLSSLSYDFYVKHAIEIRPNASNTKFFLARKDTYPFYTEVVKDGEILYG